MTALPVIFFTTLSGAGYGLLAWLGLSLFMTHARADLMPALQPLYLWGLAAGLVLSTVGLLCSLAHLGRPGHAWRALSQWRTSWLSREGVLALVTPLPAVALLTGLALLAGAPLLAWSLSASGLLGAGGLLPATCMALLAGAFLERWLFFAQARHVVSVYY